MHRNLYSYIRLFDCGEQPSERVVNAKLDKGRRSHPERGLMLPKWALQITAILENHDLLIAANLEFKTAVKDHHEPQSAWWGFFDKSSAPIVASTEILLR